MTASRYRVLIVDDHPVVRRGLRNLFDEQWDFTVCGEAADVTQALTAATQLQPDFILVDLSLPGANGLKLITEIQKHQPDLPMLVLSMWDEILYAERAILAGAGGYIMKGRPDEEILKAARQVLSGRIYLSSTVEAHLETRLPGHGEEDNPVERLTDREMAVFRLIGQGYMPRHIARELQLSPSTIEIYRTHLKEKLNLKSATQLTRYAVQWFKDHTGA